MVMFVPLTAVESRIYRLTLALLIMAFVALNASIRVNIPPRSLKDLARFWLNIGMKCLEQVLMYGQVHNFSVLIDFLPKSLRKVVDCLGTIWINGDYTLLDRI